METIGKAFLMLVFGANSLNQMASPTVVWETLV